MRAIAIICLMLIAKLGHSQKLSDPQEVIDRCITAHGGELYDQLHIDFTFRKKEYSITLDHGLYEYERIQSDSSGQILDILNNEGFTRQLNGELIELSEKMRSRYSNSLNSVAYFTLLPKGLNDQAVIKKMLPETQIKVQNYYAIEVRFHEEGGGVDHEDRFVYWIHAEYFTMDYLSYRYHVNGGGLRFRTVSEVKEVDGIRFQNYDNYKPLSKEVRLEDLPQLFEAGKLKLLSTIENEF